MNVPSVAQPASHPVGLPIAPFTPLGTAVSAEQKLALVEYWRSLTKRKWALLGLTSVAAVVAAAVALSLTPIYRSTATVLIEGSKGKILSIDDIYSGSQQREHYQTQVEILKSRDVAERTVRNIKLWEHPEFDPRKNDDGFGAKMLSAVGIRTGTDKVWTDDTLAEAVTREFVKAVTVEPVRLSQLVKVSFESADKELAAKVANSLAAQYIESDRDARFKLSQQVSSFLQDRLTSLRDKLTASEQALQQYREANGIVNLGGSAEATAGQQITATTDKLVAARAIRAELESSYMQLRAVSDSDYSSAPIVMRDSAVQESLSRLNEINRTLADLSQTLGPRNDKILAAESQKREIQSALARQRLAVARSVTRQYEAARATEKSLERELNVARSGVQGVNRQEFQLAALDREAQTNRQLYDMFMSRAKETNLASDVQASVARVVDEAVAMPLPFKPARTQIVLVTAVLALFAGAVASLLIDRLDNTVKGGDDAEIRLKQPLLSALPAVPDATRKQMTALVLDDAQSHFAEAIRTARTGILLSNIDRAHKIVLMTSTLPGEGKTTLAINLAFAHAQTARTLLIDADMRRSQVSRNLKIAPGSRGLTNLVAGTAPLGACIQKYKGSELFVMPVGDTPPNPLELLLSQRFRDVLASLSERFEMIIIDSPPVELVSEALVLTPLATGTVFVVKAMSTPAPLARKSIARLQRAGGTILGLMVNQLDFKKAHTYYGEYGAGQHGYDRYGVGGDTVVMEDHELPSAHGPHSRAGALQA